jgi:hypothetical protein
MEETPHGVTTNKTFGLEALPGPPEQFWLSYFLLRNWLFCG